MKSVAIIGLDRFGITLASTLCELGHQILCIDKSESVVQLIADMVTNAVCANYTNENALRAADIKSYDSAVICISDSMENSLLAYLAVKSAGVESVTVRAISDDHKKILEKLGVTDIIYPEFDMATKLAYRISKSKVKEYLEFSKDYSIIEIDVPDKWVGKNLMELNVRKNYGMNVIAIMHPASSEVDVTVNPSTPLKSKDKLVLIGTDKTIIEFTKSV